MNVKRQESVTWQETLLRLSVDYFDRTRSWVCNVYILITFHTNSNWLTQIWVWLRTITIPFVAWQLGFWGDNTATNRRLVKENICRCIIVYNFLFSLTYVSRFLIKSQKCHFRIYSTITSLRKFRFEIPNNLCHPEIIHFLLADVA